MASPQDAATPGHGHHGTAAAAAADGRVRVPVCGMMVDPHKTAHRHHYAGHTYSFCCNGCREKFSADPRKYLAPAPAEAKGAPAEVVPAGATYTCPMHPQIRQVGP